LGTADPGDKGDGDDAAADDRFFPPPTTP